VPPRQAARFSSFGAICSTDRKESRASGCASFQNPYDHHIVFRSAGGGEELANRTTLCAWHHLRGPHAGLVRCAAAPEALLFELGLRGPVPPLVTFGPGERPVVRGVCNAAP
jgi:hypothetical protein